MNFLKTIARAKVFDIPSKALNSIEAARAAKLMDVLTWASEEKDYNMASEADMEANLKK